MKPTDDRTCKHCGSKDTHERTVGPHLGLYCHACGKFIDWIRQNKPMEFMPFGKHQGKKIIDLPDDYLEWGIKNIRQDKVRDTFENEIAKRKGAAQIAPLVERKVLVLKPERHNSPQNYVTYGLRKK